MDAEQMRRQNDEQLDGFDAVRYVQGRLCALEAAARADGAAGAGAVAREVLTSPPPDRLRPDPLDAVVEAARVQHLPYFPLRTRFSLLKRLAMRGLRLFTARQEMVDRAVVAALEQIERRLGEQREAIDHMRGEVQAQQGAIDRLAAGLAAADDRAGEHQRATDDLATTAASLRAGLDRLEGTVEIEGDRARRAERDATAAVSSLDKRLDGVWQGVADVRQEMVGLAPTIDTSASPGLYARFEDRFRGSRETIRDRQKRYLDLIWDVVQRAGLGPLLDVGCGRGELLELARECGVRAMGVDTDSEMVRICRTRGFQVEQADALTYLRATEDEHWGAVTALQVVEHLPPQHLLAFVRLLARKLRRNGLVILETVNPHSVAAFLNFYLDPTHRRPLPAPLLEFLLQEHGFRDVSTLYLSPVGDAARLVGTDTNTARLNDVLFGPQEYAVVGYRT